VREQHEPERFAGFKDRLAMHWLAEHDWTERATQNRTTRDLVAAAIQRLWSQTGLPSGRLLSLSRWPSWLQCRDVEVGPASVNR
jgi:hypothetical protein